MSEVCRLSYGPDSNQIGDLHLPDGRGPWPVVVVIHGGFWRARYDLTLGAPLAAELAARGIAAWNIEYRRVGNGGGWPTTVLDVAAAVDHLGAIALELVGGAALRQAQGTEQGVRLDLTRVIALGHSAGGQLAAWLAGRGQLPAPFGPPTVSITGVVSQAGVMDLERAAAAHLGAGAVDDFLGASRLDEVGGLASPARLLPLGVPVRCVHGDLDDTVPIDQSELFVAKAEDLGDDAELITIAGGDHFGVVTPGDPGWAACVQAVEELLSS